MRDTPATLSTIEKAAALLRAFNGTTPEWGARQLAQHANLPRSTTHLYLRGLTHAGFLRRLPSGKYRLSWKLLELSGHLHQALPWLAQARRSLTRLAHDTRALAFLCVLEDGRVVCIDRALGDPGAEFDAVQTDVYLPPNATAAGKALYAYADVSLRTFESFTPGTITTPDEWTTELHRVRDSGYAHAIEEWVPGQCSFAAPVFHDGALAGCLGIQFPVARYTRQRTTLRDAVLRASRDLNAANVRLNRPL